MCAPLVLPATPFEAPKNYRISGNIRDLEDFITVFLIIELLLGTGGFEEIETFGFSWFD